MIPTHVLDNLGPDQRVAILSRGAEIHFHVHAAADDPAAIHAHAEREGARVLTTHMRDRREILDFVAFREREVGGEG